MYATRPYGMTRGTGVNAKVKMDGIDEALSLSQVCSRFRSLILNAPRIWNILSDQHINSDIVQYCVKRSRNAPLDVFIERFGFPYLGPEYEAFLSSCAISAARWRHLSLGKADYDIAQSIRLNWDAIRENIFNVLPFDERLRTPPPPITRHPIHRNSSVN